MTDSKVSANTVLCVQPHASWRRSSYGTSTEVAKPTHRPSHGNLFRQWVSSPALLKRLNKIESEQEEADLILATCPTRVTRQLDGELSARLDPIGNSDRRVLRLIIVAPVIVRTT